jgi:hypothetical protein
MLAFGSPAPGADYSIDVGIDSGIGRDAGTLACTVGETCTRIASFGAVAAAPLDVPHREFNRFCCRQSENGQIEVESTVAGGIGVLICFVSFAVFLHFF